MQHMCIYNTYKHHHKVPVKQMNTVVYIKYQHNIRLEDLVLYVGYEFQVCNNNKVWWMGKVFYININPCPDIGLRDGKT